MQIVPRAVAAPPSYRSLHRRCPHYGIAVDLAMHTVAGTPIDQRYAAEIWTEAELVGFINWIAVHPEDGDLIPGSGGCRKVRWFRPGKGKRGGARVIYFIGSDGRSWLLIAYAKAKFDNLPTAFLAELRREVEG